MIYRKSRSRRSLDWMLASTLISLRGSRDTLLAAGFCPFDIANQQTVAWQVEEINAGVGRLLPLFKISPNLRCVVNYHHPGAVSPLSNKYYSPSDGLCDRVCLNLYIRFDPR